MLKQIKEYFLREIADVKITENLERLRVKYLGRKGELTQILRGLKNLSVEERRKIGPLAQQLRKELEDSISQKNKQIITNYQLPITKRFDITKPGKKNFHRPYSSFVEN